MKPRNIVFSLLPLFALHSTIAAGIPQSLERDVSDQWTWFSDYYYISSEWTLNGESGCHFELGTGISIFGKPRGGITPFTGRYTFTVWGVGAIQVRVPKGQFPCRVRLDQGNVSAISVYSDPSLVKSAVEDAKKALINKKGES